MHLHFQAEIPKPRVQVFEFFRNPGNLALVYAHEPGFRLLRHGGGVEPGKMTWVQMSTLAVMPVVLGFLHDGVHAPERFWEHMVHGPFQCFEHMHEFEERGDRTIVHDKLRIELPLVYGGSAALNFVVRPFVEKSFRIRQERILHLLTQDQDQAHSAQLPA